MPEFLIPILASFLTGVGATILRVFERKLLNEKAKKTNTYLKTAQEIADKQETKDKIQDAIDINDSLIKKLNPPSFNGRIKKTIQVILLFTSLNCAGAITVPRIETHIIQSNDTISFTFTIYNDGADTAFIGSLLITTIGEYSLCDSGHTITTTVPTITDTSLHPIVAPYTLATKGIFQFVYNFKAGNRLICPPSSITEVGKANLIILNRTIGCNIVILYATPNTPSFIGYAVTQYSSQIRNNDWWRFFITL